MKTPSGYIQGYNAQAVANENQIVLAAEVASEQNDYDQLHPMIDAMHGNLEAAGVEQRVGTLIADSGYLSDDNLLAADEDTPEILIATINDRDQRIDKKAPRGRIPKNLSPTKRMARKLATKRGQDLYRKRGQIVEPVFAHRKTRGCGRFMRRGRTACDSEWKLENTTQQPPQAVAFGGVVDSIKQRSHSEPSELSPSDGSSPDPQIDRLRQCPLTDFERRFLATVEF